MTGFATTTPRQFTRAIIEEVLWWHNAIGARDDAPFAAVTYDDVMGRSKTRKVSTVRDDCILRIRRTRPDMSLPRLGLLFGGRDHTSIMAALDRPKSRMKFRKRVKTHQAVQNRASGSCANPSRGLSSVHGQHGNEERQGI